MKIELTLTIRDGFWMLSSDDLPGLNLMGEPEGLMADFIPAWRKLHEIAPNQVMPVPKFRPYPKKATKKVKKGRA